MKSMFAGFAAIVIIAVGAWYGLGELGFSTGERNAGAAVRLGDADE
ncbi:hypothetical protein [Roseovarius sp. SYSU LYC5161]|nr:hypothetical protein [Roseovarius sp.]